MRNFIKVSPIGVSLMFVGLLLLVIGNAFREPRSVHAQVNRYDSGIQTVSSSDTLLRSGIVLVKAIHCSNNTGSAATLTITDNQATPITYFPAVSMGANTVLVANYGDPGIEMQGIRWTQGTAGAIECQIAGKVN